MTDGLGVVVGVAEDVASFDFAAVEAAEVVEEVVVRLVGGASALALARSRAVSGASAVVVEDEEAAAEVEVVFFTGATAEVGRSDARPVNEPLEPVVEEVRAVVPPLAVDAAVGLAAAVVVRGLRTEEADDDDDEEVAAEAVDGVAVVVVFFTGIAEEVRDCV